MSVSRADRKAVVKAQNRKHLAAVRPTPPVLYTSAPKSDATRLLHKIEADEQIKAWKLPFVRGAGGEFGIGLALHSHELRHAPSLYAPLVLKG